jgi:rod shape-determining protein MreD
MRWLLSLPVMVTLLLVQTAVVSRMPLLHGTADLVLLVLAAWSLRDNVRDAWLWALVAGLLVSFTSAMPLLVPLAGYLIVTAIARLLRGRVWQAPILAMYVTTFAGSLVMNALYFAALKATGSPIGLSESLNQVILPSVLLNILLALPVHAIIVDLAGWVYPVEMEA